MSSAGGDRLGTVSEFDDHRGLGEVTGDDGQVLPFHCVEIADGTRSIRVGQRVRYRIDLRVVRLEAVDLRPEGA